MKLMTAQEVSKVFDTLPANLAARINDCSATYRVLKSTRTKTTKGYLYPAEAVRELLEMQKKNALTALRNVNRRIDRLDAWEDEHDKEKKA